MPALLTRPCRPPNAWAASIALPIALLRHVLAHEFGRVAEFGCKPASFGFQHIADHHTRALGDAQPCLRRALAARTAADQDDFAIETSHRRSSPSLPRIGMVKCR